MFIFLDESGDLGFNFNKSGCSKYFTITLLVCEDLATVDKIKKAVNRTIKNKINKKGKKHRIVEELKGSNTTLEVKKYFLSHMPQQGWGLFSISINKKRVYDHLQTSSGKKKLYNFMAKIIIDKIRTDENITSTVVNLVVDRCKDGKDRKDFDSYIKTHIEGAFPLETNVYITHENSQENPGLQAVDMFCYGVQKKENHQDETWYNEYQKYIKEKIDYLPTK